MTKKGNIRRLFPGGNTSLGFYSHFDHIIDVKNANHVFFVKGGPGVGKSHMMKKIGYEMVDRGYDIEFHHCAADPDSVDAVVIPELKIAMLDGTAPHVEDPKYPGAVDEVINLGDYWDEAAMKVNRKGIIENTMANSHIYKRVYKYLPAAKLIHDDIEWIYGYAMDFVKVNQATKALIKEIFDGIEDQERIGKKRHLLGSAITLEGHVDYVETYVGPMDKVLYIKGAPGTGKSTLLEKIAEMAVEKGYDIEIHHEPLVPDKIETLLIPGLDIAITTHEKYKQYLALNLNQFLDQKKIEQYREELDYSERLFKQLINDAMKNLQKTKKAHDVMESYYVPNVNFDGVNELRAKILDKILSYAK
ncbi:ATPase [Alkaliphilus metalliredigens QYMF]|uniref:ATPase n=1 Tax=Alkaliphilus metalliredigens (strain QYMF) TaxID=293826 RepID=A6TSS7_ALKMQ|nr:PRK06851 family protein [Alkaliphilus metalliredigens]ABR49245.1 ATPase [Alkaliphilus metalliredigens QYMF]